MFTVKNQLGNVYYKLDTVRELNNYLEQGYILVSETTEVKAEKKDVKTEEMPKENKTAKPKTPAKPKGNKK